MIIAITGVTGSGKTTIGKLLAERTGAIFADADDYHSPANKAKMAAGHPLNDQDRQPWLEKLNGVLLDWRTSGKSGVLACSALKEKYRETLAAGMPANAVLFILLDVPPDLLTERLAHRQHEFMNPNLLNSQLETLEPLQHGLTIHEDGRPPEGTVGEILQKLAEGTGE